MSSLQSLLSRSATSSSGTLTCSTQPHGRHDRCLARSVGQRVEIYWQTLSRRCLACASCIVFEESLTAARCPLGWLQTQEVYAPTLQFYISCMPVGPYLRGGVPLAHSDAALHCPLQSVPVHSDGEGDAQLICPCVPLADCGACGSPSRALSHGALHGSMYGTQGHADRGSQKQNEAVPNLLYLRYWRGPPAAAWLISCARPRPSPLTAPVGTLPPLGEPQPAGTCTERQQSLSRNCRPSAAESVSNRLHATPTSFCNWLCLRCHR